MNNQKQPIAADSVVRQIKEEFDKSLPIILQNMVVLSRYYYVATLHACEIEKLAKEDNADEAAEKIQEIASKLLDEGDAFAAASVVIGDEIAKLATMRAMLSAEIKIDSKPN